MPILLSFYAPKVKLWAHNAAKWARFQEGELDLSSMDEEIFFRYSGMVSGLVSN